jgi:hypothetical protein
MRTIAANAESNDCRRSAETRNCRWYDSNLIRQCKFLFDQIYSMLSQAQDFILQSRDQILRLMINTNSHVTIVLNEFLEKLQINVFDYSTFYFEHSRFHVLQLKDYFVSESRSMMHALVSLTLNIWSKYCRKQRYRSRIAESHDVATVTWCD